MCFTKFGTITIKKMKEDFSVKKVQNFTLIELLVVIAIIAILGKKRGLPLARQI